MLLNTIESAENGSEMQQKANKSEMVRDTVKNKCTAAAKASSNFSSEEYRQSFRIKRCAFRLVPPNGAILVCVCIIIFCIHRNA